ncbi:tetratricopeptide repeat protein [Amycolatopsis sp. NPDC101161]|uniref:tetratricopeptide repeat protein n=1 Tax=Amycolatopsis sp. NPDC101161 TaxID=3363940 RepID=UPI00380196C9
MDPAEITTLAQLANALKQLRGSLSLRQIDAAAAELPLRGGRQPALPKSTASNLLNAESVPEAETVVTFLAVCGIRDTEAQRPWLQALQRVASQHHRRPPGAMRVREARPRVLGVHAAIQTTQPPEDTQSGPLGESELPPYVQRDFDADLRTKLTLAGQRGGFVLLVGDSSAGKTRALFEAVKAVLPDWWLLHPRDTTVLRKFAEHPTGRTVVWLDELQDYLDFAGGVPAGHIREMIAAGVVLVATCWPGEYRKRVALPEEGRPDPYANDRRLLGLADVLHVPAAFSSYERRRAEDLAGTDHRIRVALDTLDAGFTQVMAAGPELIRHWEEAPAYAKGVITAALDARRVGAHAPLTRDYLADAVPGYLNEREVATALSGWLEDALDYATRLLHGATAALTPVPAGMGTIAGYRVADYLHQYALHARRGEHLPDTVWHALVRHHHPDDTLRLADNAYDRGRDHEALTLCHQLAGKDNGYSAVRLVVLLAERGLVEEAIQLLRERADNGDKHAASQLADLLAEQGLVEEAIQLLRERADNGDRFAASRLADLLVEQGQVEEAIKLLRERADNGDLRAIYRLADLLTEQGQVDDANQVLRPHVDDRIWVAASTRARRLAEQGKVAQLRVLADSGDEDAASQLAVLLSEQGQVDDAIQILRRHVDRPVEFTNGNEIAAETWAWLLARHGRTEQLRDRADNGDKHAASQLADLLAEQGHVEELRERADNGNRRAADRLVDLLTKEERLEDLEREVAAGTAGAVAALRRARSLGATHGD